MTNALLLEGDAFAWMDALPDASVHLIFADLPYGTTRNPWDSVLLLDPLWRAFRRLLAPRGAIVCFGQGLFTAELCVAGRSWYRYRLVWVKSKPTNFLNAKKQPLRKFEDLIVFYPSPPTYHPQKTPGRPYDKGVRKDQATGSYGDFAPVRVQSNGERYPTDVLTFPTAEAEGPVWHPTQKPVALAEHVVRTYTDPGDVVLDPTFGSGSLLVGAVKAGRRAVGIEQNEDARAFRKDPVDLVNLAQTRVGDARIAAKGEGATTVLRRGAKMTAWARDPIFGDPR